VKEVAVVCPSFFADCLETLDEVGREARHAFLSAGGERFTLVPCLNATPGAVRTVCAVLGLG
jgi:ferrochelatase